MSSIAETIPSKLEPRHQNEILKRGLTPDFAIASGVISIADNEARNLGFLTSIPNDQRNVGLQGILFPYRDISGGNGIYRLKPDQAVIIGDKRAKYLSRKGDPPKIFLPHTTLPEHKINPKINLLITEGEFKALALAEHIVPITSRPTCVIGLQGVNGGWHRDKITVTLPDGTKEIKKEGHSHLVDDLEEWEWKKRVVYIVFDSDVGTKLHASSFLKSKSSGAIGAEYQLALLLRGKGADVRIVEIPHSIGQPKMGIDDYILQYGKHQALKLIYNNYVIERNVEKILHYGDPASFTFLTASQLVASKPAKPPFIIDKILPIGGVMVIAAAPKVGKSSIALNAAHAVATEAKFLNEFAVQKGIASYIQTEIPAWSMAERLTKIGAIPEGLNVLTPLRMALNFWEEDGYQKRRETGNRQIAADLVHALRNQGANLVIIDPYRHFSTLNENNVDHVTHMFEIFRNMAQAINCGIIIVHHHRKIQRSQNRYEGAEDMSGSGAFFGEPDAILSIYKNVATDGTARYKMVFDTRHSEPIDPFELFRRGGDNCMLWEANPWEDHTRSGAKLKSIEKVFEVIQEQGPIHPDKIISVVKVNRSTVFRNLAELKEKHRIIQKGNLYECDFGE